MSTYYIQPDISTWRDSLNPFTTTILAYDDSNIRINNKQFYIVYDITYDDTIPDLENNGHTLYSDKDGRIELFFNQRCRISIDLYMVSQYDDTIDVSQMADPDKYVCHHICNNLIIPFEPYITNIEAKYISDFPIAVNSNIPRKYIQIFVTKSDNTTTRFTIESNAYDNYVLTPNIITHIGDNTIQVSYHDPILNKVWISDIIISGKVQELLLEATYIGISIDTDGDGQDDHIREKQLNNLVTKSEILVALVSYDGYEESRRFLTNEEWEFVTFPQITNLNLGIFEIMRNDLRCNVRVPFVWLPINSRIDAWYEGYPVLVGEKIVPDDFRIYLYKPNNNRELIPFDQCQIDPDDFTIHNVGTNWFTVRYKFDNFTISDKVAIIGYEEIKYPEKDFELLYYNPLTHSVEDVTDEFDEVCKIAGRRWFNWNKILERINEISGYGAYKLHAPKLSGLSTRYDTEWYITCKYKKALEAMLLKECIKKEE